MAGSYDVYYVNSSEEIIASNMSSVTIYDADIDPKYHLKSLKVMGKDLPDFVPGKFNYVLELSQREYDSLNKIIDEIVAVPADSTGTTYIIEGTTDKNARVQVFVLPEFGPLPYTVTAVVAGASIEEPVVEDPVVEDPADKDLDDRDSDPSTDVYSNN